MLADDDGIAVVAEASSDEHVVPIAQEGAIDVAIGDPEHLGAEAITGLVALGVAVMLVSSQSEERALMRAIGWGCAGYLEQDEIRPGDLPRLVRLAAKGYRTQSERAFDLLRATCVRTRRY
jgi:DNA-binding NarL/FixJ family response regulator